MRYPVIASHALHVALSTTIIMAGIGTVANAMSAYTWKKRPLVVIAPADDNAELARQRGIIASARAGFAERDMVIVYVVGDTVSVELGGLPSQSASALRARFGVGKGAFRVLLVGKDGGVKLSRAAPLGSGALFGEIDAMPMRIDEMRRRK